MCHKLAVIVQNVLFVPLWALNTFHKDCKERSYNPKLHILLNQIPPIVWMKFKCSKQRADGFEDRFNNILPTYCRVRKVLYTLRLLWKETFSLILLVSCVARKSASLLQLSGGLHSCVSLGKFSPPCCLQMGIHRKRWRCWTWKMQRRNSIEGVREME